MKNIFKISLLPVLTLFVGLCSCQKEHQERMSFLKGGDLDDPIVIGIVKNSDSQPINSAVVELYPENSSEVLDSAITNENGNFSFTLEESGSYYFKAYEEGSLLATTEAISITDSSYIEIIEGQ